MKNFIIISILLLISQFAFAQFNGTDPTKYAIDEIIPNSESEVSILAPIQIQHETTPSTPGSGFAKIYAKSDDFLYFLNSAGTETQLSFLALTSSNDNRLVKTVGTDGLSTEETGIIVDDSDNISGVGTFSLSGILTTASDIIMNGTGALKLPVGTQAQRPSAQEGMLRGNSDSGSFEGYINGAWGPIGGSGGAGGEFSYLQDNDDAEEDTMGWTVYANTTASDAPDDFGGTPSGGVTFTRNTTTPLFENADFKLSKDASNRQGEGVYYEFEAYKWSLGNVYRLISMINTSDANIVGDETNGYDLKVYLVSSSDDFVSDFNVIHPSVPGVKAGTTELLKSIQLDASDTKYRLCFHIASTSALAYSVYLDEVKFLRQQTVSGPPIIYLGQLTTTGNWPGTYTVDYFRVGNKLFSDGRLTLSGTPTGNLTINLPNGLSIDTEKTVQDTSQSMNYGEANAFNGSSLFPSRTHHGTSTSVTFRAFNASGTYANHADVTPTVPFTWASGHSMYFKYEVPIQGWDSQARMSHESSTREIHGDVVIGSSATHPGGNTNVVVPFNTVFRDTIGSWNSTSYYFEIKESDTYDISAAVLVGTGTIGYSNIVIQDSSGSDIRNFNLAGNGSTSYGGSTTTYLEKGQRVLVKVYTQTSGNYQSAGNGNYLTIRRSANPQTNFETETVAARYTSDSGQSIPNNTLTTVIFEDKDFDFQNAMNTSTGVYTVKYSGVYYVGTKVDMTGRSVSTGRVYINAKFTGSVNQEVTLDVEEGDSTGYDLWPNNGSTTKYLNAGDTIEIQISQASGGTRTLGPGTNQVYIDIARIK